jgi:hypothetical protein
MAQVNLDGALTVGPLSSGGTTLPTLVNTVPFSTSPSPKPVQVYVGKEAIVQSAGAYVQLSGVGTSDTVTHANFLYLKTSAAFKLRLTIVDTPSNLVSESYCYGLVIQEFPEEHALIKIEAMGSGALELVAAGNS